MRTRWLLVIFVGMTTLLVALIAVKLDNVQHKAMALKKPPTEKPLSCLVDHQRQQRTGGCR